MGGNLDQPLVVGLEHPEHRPTGLGEGEWKLYTKWGDNPKHNFHAQEKKWIITLDKQKITVDIENKTIKFETENTSILLEQTGKKITLKADEIILDGNCKLGGTDASQVAAHCGPGCATKVLVK